MPKTAGAAASRTAASRTPGLVVSWQRMLGVFLTAWILISGLSVLWAFATPIAAAPDEPAHMVKAASVALGQFVGSGISPDGTVVQVPQYIAWTHAQTCTAMNDEVTANCLPAVPGDPAEIVNSTTTAGLYNPVYYILVGWPTLIFDDSSGVYAMRVVSAILTSAFLALTVMMVSTWRNRTLPMIGVAVGITPMVLFLAGTVNPNTLEIAATLAAFAALVSAVAQPNPRMLTHRAVIVAVSAAVAANMRGLSPLWLAVALLAPFVLASRQEISALAKTWAVRIAVSITALSVLFAVIWVLLSNSLGARPDVSAGAPDVPYLGASPLTGFLLMLVRTGANLQQMIASFGWMDTAAPVEVYSAWTLFIGGLVLIALLATRGKQFAFVGVLGLAFLLLPPIAQAGFITNGGFIWQGRYTLPLLVVLVLGCASVLGEKFDALPLRTNRALVIGFWVTWSAAQLYAFASTLRRYAVGQTGAWPDAFLHPLWAPPGGAIALVAMFAAAAAIVAVLQIQLARRDRIQF